MFFNPVSQVRGISSAEENQSNKVSIKVVFDKDIENPLHHLKPQHIQSHLHRVKILWYISVSNNIRKKVEPSIVELIKRLDHVNSDGH